MFWNTTLLERSQRKCSGRAYYRVSGSWHYIVNETIHVTIVLSYLSSQRSRNHSNRSRQYHYHIWKTQPVPDLCLPDWQPQKGRMDINYVWQQWRSPILRQIDQWDKRRLRTLLHHSIKPQAPSGSTYFKSNNWWVRIVNSALWRHYRSLVISRGGVIFVGIT